MAEEPRTSEGTGPAATAAPGAQSPEPPLPGASSTTVEVPLAPAPTPQVQQQPDHSSRIAELEQQLQRYKSNIDGRQAEAKRYQDEAATLRAQLQQNQALLQNLGSALTGQQPAQAKRPANFKEALDRYLAGDDSAVADMPVGTQPQPDINQLVDTRLQTYLAYMQRQQSISTAHPELADRNNPVYKEVFESYDGVAADPLVQNLFPRDDSMLVSIVAPDGTENKTMDLRVLDRAFILAKSRTASQRGAQEERGRQDVGTTLSGSGRQTSSQGNQVEAHELFSSSEIAQYSDPDFLRSMPKNVPREPKALMKWLFEGLTPREKQQRLENYRLKNSRLGA